VLEVLGLVFLASSRKDLRSVGVTVIASLIEMVRTSDAFEKFALPKDGYQALVNAPRAVPILSNGHACLKNALRVITLDTDGAKSAWDELFDYFWALSQAPNPKSAARGEQTVDLPVSELMDEWMSISSILFAIVSTAAKSDRLFGVAIELMEDPDHLGMSTAATLPTAIHTSGLMKFVRLVLKQVGQGRASAVFAWNAMKVLRGMAEQKYWMKAQSMHCNSVHSQARWSPAANTCRVKRSA
jgi:hypothetical protein